jgi:hypothetical protein
MKKITLNTLLFSLLVSCSFLFVVSCTEENIETVKHSVSVDELLLDENFMAIGESLYSYAGFIKSTIEEKGLSSTNMKSEIDAIAHEESSNEEKEAKFNAIFKTDMSVALHNNANVISTNMTVLKSKYTGVDEALLESALAKHFENKNVANSGARGCSQDFYVCAGMLAGSSAGICFIACTAYTVGVGAPACAVFCGVLYAGAAAACYNVYCS